MKNKYSSSLLGENVYLVYAYSSRTQLITKVITGVHCYADDQDDELIFDGYANFPSYSYKRFLSLKKAENFLAQFNIKRERREARDRDKLSYDIILKQKIEDFENVVPTKVIIRTSKKNNEWKTFTRSELFILHKCNSPKNTIGFRANGNIYSFENEGRNWKWFTEYDELLVSKAYFEKQLKDVQIRLGDLEGQPQDRKPNPFRKPLPKSTRKFVMVDTDATVGDFETSYNTPSELLEEVKKGTSFVNLFIVDYLGTEEMNRQLISVEQLIFMVRRSLNANNKNSKKS